jgi:hypothetical protein
LKKLIDKGAEFLKALLDLLPVETLEKLAKIAKSLDD